MAESMEKMDGGSWDETAANVAAVKALFPEAVREGKINFEVLKSCLGEAVETGKASYSFIWNGKEEARAFSRARSMGTLRPCREESKDWDTTGNLYIEGDNLEVLKLLQGAYHRRVKMIYIDPPYNTGKDFVYADNFHDSIRNYKEQTGQVDSDGRKLRANAETSGRYHTDWLNMLFPRLLVARNLLRDDGVLFMSIDDNEVVNARKLCDEVFGEDNFVAQIVWQNKKGGGNDSKFIAVEHEYILVYSKNKDSLSEFYERYSDEYAKRYKEEDEQGKFFWDTFKRKIGKQYYPIECPDGSILQYDSDGNAISWLRSEARFKLDKAAGEIKFEKQADGTWSIFFKQRMPMGKKPRSIFETTEVLSDYGTTSTGAEDSYQHFKRHVFSNPKPVRLLKFLMQFVLEKSDIVFDFFSGSGTTAEALMALNEEYNFQCKFVLVQLPEDLKRNFEAASNENAKVILRNAIAFLEENGKRCSITELAKERIRRAGQKLQEEPLVPNDQKEYKEVEGQTEDLFATAENTEHEDMNPPVVDATERVSRDVGFRVYKLDTSNVVAWNPNAADLELELQNAADNILLGRPAEDLFVEVLLKSNIPLTAEVAEAEHAVGECVIRIVNGGELFVCLDAKITVEVAEEMARLAQTRKSAALPWSAVFRETGFASDEDKANALTTLKSAGVESVRTI